MYTTGLSYNRCHRPGRSVHRQRSGMFRGTTTALSWRRNSRPEAPVRRTRYTRSSTTSVAQLLSESCTTLLQKLTTKVRGPSEAATATKRPTNSFNPLATSKSTATIANLGSTRTRLEDKYSSVLESITSTSYY
ncbi:hypothetical protein MTP99_019618 [Tenebrio molitor]|nr:hypothetical protein MTP99_019618 [Tenebrio molitor]